MKELKYIIPEIQTQDELARERAEELEEIVALGVFPQSKVAPLIIQMTQSLDVLRAQVAQMLVAIQTNQDAINQLEDSVAQLEND